MSLNNLSKSLGSGALLQSVPSVPGICNALPTISSDIVNADALQKRPSGNACPKVCAFTDLYHAISSAIRIAIRKRFLAALRNNVNSGLFSLGLCLHKSKSVCCKFHTFIIPFLLLFNLYPAFAQSGEDISKPVQFSKKMVASESYESVGVFDINGDDTLDIISGAFWYEGPRYENRHFVREVSRFGPEYYDDFSNIIIDINGDGHQDYVTGGWGSKNIVWLENPGNNEAWKETVIDTTGPVECTRAWDVDGDGHLEIVPNNPGSALKFYKLERDAQGKASGKFTRINVADKQGHGLGFGDINGDGKGDFIISNGWLEAPADPLKGKWIMHEDFTIGTVSVPVLIEDVNDDGKNDIIAGQGHGYGLDWYEQSTDDAGNRSWIKHPIDPFNAQFHTMEWADVTGDGKPELITGKRFRAHNGHDPGSTDPLGLYYFQWNGDSFTKYTISYGPMGEGKGAGLYFAVVDLRGTGRNDIVVAGKDGLCIFYNEGYAGK